MATTLQAALLDPDRRPVVVADLEQVVDDEAADTTGVSGGLVKAGYAAVRRVRPGIIPGTIDGLLDEFVDALEPLWTEYHRGRENAADFGAFLHTRPGVASEALLAVTDRRAERSRRPAITTVYSRMRPRARENVIEALPRLGRAVERHAGR